MNTSSIITTRKKASARKKRWLFFAATFLFSFSNPVFSGIYKWVDEDGNIHFSDKKFQNKNTETITIQSNSVKVVISPPSPEPKEKKRPSKNKQQDNKNLNPDKRCFESRRDYTLLQYQLPIYIDNRGKFKAKWKYDAYKGTRKYMDDSQRSIEIKRTLNHIKQFCKKPNDKRAMELAQRYWIKKEFCLTAKADLKELKNPRSRTPEDEINSKKKTVKLYCK